MPAFIHIPKTGGTYLAQIEGKGEPVLQPLRYFGHRCVVTKVPSPVYPPMGYQPNFVVTKGEVGRYFVFSTVRNPFSFFVSYYYHAGGHNPKYRDVTHYDYLLCQNSFEYFLKTVAERYNPWPSRKFIHTQLFCDDGDLIVDWINRNESLDDDLRRLADHTGATFTRKPPQRVGVKDDYRRFYTDELVDLVNTIWKRELDMFGYGFSSQPDDESPYYLKIPTVIKQKTKYRWETDKAHIPERKEK